MDGVLEQWSGPLTNLHNVVRNPWVSTYLNTDHTEGVNQQGVFVFLQATLTSATDLEVQVTIKNQVTGDTYYSNTWNLAASGDPISSFQSVEGIAVCNPYIGGSGCNVNFAGSSGARLFGDYYLPYVDLWTTTNTLSCVGASSFSAETSDLVEEVKPCNYKGPYNGGYLVSNDFTQTIGTGCPCESPTNPGPGQNSTDVNVP